ncbi:hypothetical protein PanWU01x14_357380 [Parasponia andersonii]|uniref:Uncharacterized protein n=1 Tax=Parasponia andersonii TaxID=3476 RepID=A0A2P5A8N7_PARAD|nr:hypothetical protein PanWU01x14_357380 [Parasponia andersonii]
MPSILQDVILVRKTLSRTKHKMTTYVNIVHRPQQYSSKEILEAYRECTYTNNYKKIENSHVHVGSSSLELSTIPFPSIIITNFVLCLLLCKDRLPKIFRVPHLKKT